MPLNCPYVFIHFFFYLFVSQISQPRLNKFIQKIDLNSRMTRIFIDSVDRSAFYIYVFSCYIYARLDAVLFIGRIFQSRLMYVNCTLTVGYVKYNYHYHQCKYFKNGKSGSLATASLAGKWNQFGAVHLKKTGLLFKKRTSKKSD